MNKVLVIFCLLSTILLSHGVLAGDFYIQNTNGVGDSTSGGFTSKAGSVFQPNETINLVAIQLWSGATPTHWYVINYSDCTELSSGAFSGEFAFMEFLMISGEQYFIGADAEGGPYTRYYSSLGSVPYAQSHGSWTNFTYDACVLDTTPYHNIQNISIETDPLVPTENPYTHVIAYDLADNSTIQGLTVTWDNGKTNTTDASGIAHCYNCTGQNFNITDNTSLYFNYTGYAAENQTTVANVHGAHPLINAYDLLGARVYNYTVCLTNTTTCNTTVAPSGVVNLVLYPNTTNINLTISAWDGGNTTNRTFINSTHLVNTTGQDTSNKTLNGLYQALVGFNVSMGVTAQYVQNFTINITYDYDSNTTVSGTTTSYVVYQQLMANTNYSVLADPEGRSYSYKNITIDYLNHTPMVTLPSYSVNSFYFSILDEITRVAITDTMTIELISIATAGNYTTGNGSLALELLTPADYTIRWRGDNYSERDYFQTLVDNNYYDINLYSLSNSESTTMLVTIQDTSGEPVENAIVKLLRYYVYCNCYEVVEMAATSYSGEALFIADAYDGHYKFVVEKNGVTYFTSATPDNFVPESSGFIERTITINLGEDYYESYRGLTNMNNRLMINETTGVMSYTWNDPGGYISSACLYVEYLDGVNYVIGNSSCGNGTTGSIVMQIPEWRNHTYHYWAIIETNTNYSEYLDFNGWIDKFGGYTFGQFGSFISGTVVIGMALLFSYSAIGVLVVTAVGLIAMSVLSIAPFTTTFIIGFAALILGFGVYLVRR